MSKHLEYKKQWELLSEELIYEGFYSLSRVEFKHTKFNGEWTGVVNREVLNRGNVIGVLAHDPTSDKIALVEQFRFGGRYEDDNPWLLEVIAGMVESGEQPEDVAMREAKEEADLDLANLRLIRQYYSSPSSTSEQVFIYYAETDLNNAGGVHGLDAEDEDILVHLVTVDEAVQMMEDCVIKNAISVIAVQWLQHQRAIGAL